MLNHIEGGAFSVIYQSDLQVKLSGKDNELRNAGGLIIFMLKENEVSCWHKLEVDETFIFIKEVHYSYIRSINKIKNLRNI